jgi:hypothetical protein
MKETFKSIVSNPKKLLAAFVAAGATAAVAAAAASLLKALSPVAATAYTILTVKATSENGETAFSAELQSLKTIEFTIGKAPGPQVKPMLGFGTSMDAGKMLNKMFNPTIKDEKGKAIDVKGDVCKDKAKAALPECDEPDHRGKMCQMCCELMGNVRPKEADEKKMQTAAGNTKVCAPGVDPKTPGPKGVQRGAKGWFCSGSKDALAYSPKPASGVKNACTPAQLKDDGHEVTQDQCEIVRLDLKTALGANTKSGIFGAIAGNDQGSSVKGFVKKEKEKMLYKQAMKVCAPDAKSVSNNPDCLNEAMCRFFAVACNPAEL